MDFAEFLALFGTTQVILTGLATYLGKVWLARITERIKQDHQRELVALKGRQSEEITRLERKLDRAMQFDQTELAVWEQLRKDIVQEMWTEHRELMKSMSAVHIKMQEYWGAMTDEDGLYSPDSWAEHDDLLQRLVPGREPTVEQYRHLWRNHALISPDGVRTGHEYLLTVYNFMDYMHSCLERRASATPDRISEFSDKAGEFNSHLFQKQREFKEHTAKQFGLEKVIPWMVRTSGVSHGEKDTTLGNPT
jgi:hypothetical protein